MTIETAFFDLVAAIPGGYPVAWPVIDFNPPATGYWLEVDLFRGNGIDLTVSAGSGYVPQGIAQVTVCTYAKSGIIGLIAVAEAVKAAIPKGTAISDGMFISREPVILSYLIESDRIKIPVSFTYSR